MRRSVRPIALLAALLLPVACHEGAVTSPSGVTSPDTTTLPRPLTGPEQHLIAADNGFAFKLYGALAARESPDSNVFISPLSVGMALGMTVNGAAGATRDSMLAALQLPGVAMSAVNQSYQSVIELLQGLDSGVTFTLANSIWYRSTFRTPGQAFLDAARTYFDAQVQGLDFNAPTAVQTINDWVSLQTRGKIPTIVDAPIDPSLVMYVINAIYFKGSWTQRFDSTRDQPFVSRTGAALTVSMMTHDSASPVRLYFGPDATVVDLPYGGGAYAMTIVLARSPAAIDTLSATLTQDRWDAWIAGLGRTAAIVDMPKFTLTYGRELEPVLSALGMKTAFCDGGGSPDFSAMYPGVAPGDICISSVTHKTYVDVDEEGTEAAAVTAVGTTATAMPAAPLHIVVNHPFIVAIRERLTGTILFLGRVVNPAASRAAPM